MYLLASILCLALSSALGADVMEGDYNVNEICSTVPDGTPLASIVSCDYYYVCTKDGPVKTFCVADYSYNLKTGKCAPSSTVACFYGISDPCLGKKGENWVPKAGTCNGYTYCEDEKVVGSGFCHHNQYFDGVSQTCKNGKCDNQLGSQGPTLRDVCQVVQPGKYFGDTEDCQRWNFCKPDGSLVTQKCIRPVYIVSLELCGDDTSECERIKNPVKPTECVEDVEEPLNNIVADDKVCSTYYQCEGTTNKKLTCSTGYYFDINTKGCVLRQLAHPAATCDRCQYTTVSFVNNVGGEDCNTYYHCKNGIKNGDVTTCPKEFFFNEDLQGCARSSESAIEEYLPTHGACKAEEEEVVPE